VQHGAAHEPVQQHAVNRVCRVWLAGPGARQPVRHALRVSRRHGVLHRIAEQRGWQVPVDELGHDLAETVHRLAVRRYPRTCTA